MPEATCSANCCPTLVSGHDPLSLTTMSGMPGLAKMDFACVITQVVVAHVSNTVSQKLV